MPIITPTVGRVVWFRGGAPGAQPEAALVTYVWGDRLVNLVVFDANGNPRGQTSVTLVQAGDEVPTGHYCEWMPYQQGQAAKAEALGKELAKSHLPPSKPVP